MYDELGRLVGVSDTLARNPLLPHLPLPERLGVTVGLINTLCTDAEVAAWEMANPISASEIDDMIREVDPSGEGQIDYVNFVKTMLAD